MPHKIIQHKAIVSKDVVEILYSSLFNGVLLTFIAFTAITFGLPNSGQDEWRYPLWIAMLFVLALRTIDGFFWHLKLKNDHHNPTWSLLRFSAGAFASSAVWAIFTLSSFAKLDMLQLFTTAITLSAMAGGGATILAPWLPLVLLYTTLMVMPFSLLAIFDTKAELNLLGYLGALFWLGVCIAGKQANTFIKTAIRTKHDNDNLLNIMREDRNKMAHINKALINTNHKLDLSNATLESEVKRRTADLHKLVNRDPLTGLLNRNGFVQQLEHLLEQAQTAQCKLAVLFIDLDGFKQINDSLGHQAGDSVLCEVSNRLTKYSEVDCLGRWGGDEFILIISYTDFQSTQTIALAAKNNLKKVYAVNDSEVRLDATIGIAFFPDHGTDASTLVQLADLTMYNQKHNAPGTIGIYSDELYAKLQYQQRLREGLNRAIEKQQLDILYQPILHADSQKPWAVEALMRWDFGSQTVGPGEFIPIAETTGAIIELGNWVLNRACIDIASWHDDSLHLSVNVSVLQLMNDDFINQVDLALKSSGLAPERLHLEVTESIFADDIKLLTQQISALKARQINIAIDDFGTGFSSLSLLQKLDFDLLKIDRTFVENLVDGKDGIVRATILMAKELGCSTVAEGIETSEQAQVLKAMGVDYLQGYLYARPLNKHNLFKWYTEHC